MRPQQQMARYTEQIHDKSLGELLSELADHSASLVRDEIALARQELREKVRDFRTAVMLLAVGAVGALIAVMSLCAALVLILTAYMKPWQSALLVGIVLSLIAGALLALGLSQMKHTDLKPEQTLETLEENKEWLKELT